VYLLPGEAISRTVDLSTWYQIVRLGDYEVSFVLRINDAFEKGDATPPRKLKDHRRITVISNSINFRVLPGDMPSSMSAPMPRFPVRTTTPRTNQTSVPPAPVFISISDPDEVRTAFYWAYSAVLECITTLEGGTAPPAVYTTWFGTNEGSNEDYVLTGFVDIKNYLLNNQITFNGADAAGVCTENRYAYVKPSEHLPIVYLCSLYFNWVRTSPEDRMSLIVHEISHLAYATADYTYGEPNCQSLADTDPGEAIDNADNYRFFAAAVDPGKPPANNGIWTDNTKAGTNYTQLRPAAAGSVSSHSLMLVYQDQNKDRAYLWYDAYYFPNKSWNEASRVPNGNSHCVTQCAPAITSWGQAYFVVYVDGDQKSQYYNNLVYTNTFDNGANWAEPSLVCSNTPVGPPALTTLKDKIYCVYPAGVPASSPDQCQLYCVVGMLKDTGIITWESPNAIGSCQTTVPPALVAYNDKVYCMYTGVSEVYPFAICFTTSADGQNWTAEQVLGDSLTGYGVGLAVLPTEEPGAPPLLICGYTGTDTYLRYITSDGEDWSLEYRENSNKSNGGVAIAAHGPDLYQFNKGLLYNNVIYWSQTTSPSDRRYYGQLFVQSDPECKGIQIWGGGA
jgi:hypothetical protein